MAGIELGAIPAWRGVITLEQPDGTALKARLYGDEFAHVMTDLNGNALIQNDDGFWCYGLYSPDGSIHSSGKIAGTTVNPYAANSYIPYTALSMLGARRRRDFMASISPSVPSIIPASAESANIKNRHCLILLAEFNDVKMTYSRDRFGRMISLGEKSAKRYFENQFPDGYTFTFEIGPVVTLSKNLKYYGHNTSAGTDAHAAEAVAEACHLSKAAGVDFSAFDDDGDGRLDNLFVFVAGKDEAEGGGDDCIWSHAWSLSAGGIDLTIDGMKIDKYAISTELGLKSNGKYSFTTIGTFCHEYSHILGLMDMYDTDMEASGGTSKGLWGSTSLMDRGVYNDEGRTPPFYNAIERHVLRIGNPEQMTAGEYTLEPVNEKGRYLIYETQNAGEYYLIECRANDMWDGFTGGRGLAIYHIDSSANMTGKSAVYGREATAAERWTSNEINCNPSHQCAAMIEAYPNATDVSQVFFPYEKYNSFTSRTTPAFRFWNGTASPLSITDIVSSGKNISFKVVSSSETIVPTAIITKKDIFQDMAIIQWKTGTNEEEAAHVSWGLNGKEGKKDEVYPYAPGEYALRLEYLKPGTTYYMKIQYGTDQNRGKETAFTFTTKSFYPNGYPFIYLNSSDRNSDGSFTKGSSLPLAVFNMGNARSVEWFMDGRSIVPSGNGYYQLTRNCTIRAIITYIDGSIDIIEKEISIK